jgi:hypothetical protein
VVENITPWGVAVELLEMKDVEIPQDMQRVMAMEAEAMREKRARIIKADAELEASKKLAEAAQLMVGNPAALELRRMQMVAEVVNVSTREGSPFRAGRLSNSCDATGLGFALSHNTHTCLRPFR